ncbi:MAG TPA: hypothetical protein VKW78_04510 [Terriglobales bacterium]|nr:hypothetical protein [Terriglobales bacterium]
MRNPEYLAVLEEAVESVRSAMADRRLPDLDAEQLTWWFQNVTVSDINEIMSRNHRPARVRELRRVA